ncbi:MAG: 1-acyl-sn-glycerol-3-phosphate acyltransferase, partial [Oscillospiraceae bacterium]|nr:1-acyl-sn-glycerol-3-phosphate acyltransferase [Oscillospiraceae bacterium]
MKIRIVKKPYAEVAALPRPKHKKPMKMPVFFRVLLKLLCLPAMLLTRFECRKIGMEKLGKKEPCLYLMNHSGFIDMKIASSILFPRPFNIVCTTDGFVGKGWLMRLIGCIPTQKFVRDLNLVKDMAYALNELKSSVLMYPEAGYSLDGCKGPLPDSLGRCIKLLGVPVVMIRTYGAFSHIPLYNELRQRKVKISADMEYVLSPDEIEKLSVDEINAVVARCFDFDSFRWQQENRIAITEKTRAVGLGRVLYKCPHCLTEGGMKGEGTRLTCTDCGASYELDEYGFLRCLSGEGKFDHVPDWFAWQRECVREELLNGSYLLDTDVDIMMMADMSCVYDVGSGRLTHDASGFHLTGC